MFANICLLKFVCLSIRFNTILSHSYHLTSIPSSCLLLVDEVEVGQQLPLLLLYVELQAVQVLLVPLVPPQELLELLQLVLELLVVLPLQYELVLYDLRPLQGSCVLRLQLLCTQAFLLLPLLVPVQLLHLLLLVDEHHKEEEDKVDVVQVDEEDLLLNFLVLVVKENLLLLLVDATKKMLSNLMKISTPTSLSSAYILKTSSYTSSPNLK